MDKINVHVYNKTIIEKPGKKQYRNKKLRRFFGLLKFSWL